MPFAIMVCSCRIATQYARGYACVQAVVHKSEQMEQMEHGPE